jgi:hypothetical protein
MNENQNTAQERAFEYQLHILEKEVENIESGIVRFDEHTCAIRNWTANIFSEIRRNAINWKPVAWNTGCHVHYRFQNSRII